MTLLIIYVIGFFISLVIWSALGEFGVLDHEFNAVQAFVMFSIAWPLALIVVLIFALGLIILFPLMVIGELVRRGVKKIIKKIKR